MPDLVHVGGLMRCCLATLGDLYTDDGPAEIAAEGQRLQCKYAGHGSDHGWMVFRSGYWEWDHD